MVLDIEKYLPTIGHTIKKMSVPWDEFFDIGLIGLWKACQTYDPNLEGRLSPEGWCIRNIRHEIIRELCKMDHYHNNKKYKDLNKYGPSSYKEIINGIKYLSELKDYSLLVESKNGDEEYDETVADVDMFLKSLTEREHMILRLHEAGLTMREIGSIIGTSRQRVSEIFVGVKKKAAEFFDVPYVEGKRSVMNITANDKRRMGK